MQTICVDTTMNRAQQVISLLLSTMPIAERLLLVQLATTAWIMLQTPSRPAPQNSPVA